MATPAPISIDDITALDASALSQAIHARSVSCRAVMQAYLARIQRLNPRYNALVSLRPEDDLLADADACDAELERGQSRGWMHGMPQAIKDLSNAAGLPTTLGSPLMRGFVANEDGLMVARMKAAGCIVIGKSNTPEFGLGSHTFNPVFGTTLNAYDPARSAGGSSGGAAVALALRLLPVADGSDFMGSLRNPAAWANIFGFRPSQGRVPMWPAQDVWISQLGTEGPMGRSVRDLQRLLATQAGWSPNAPLSIAEGAYPEMAGGLFDVKSTRIAWLADLDRLFDENAYDAGGLVEELAPCFTRYVERVKGTKFERLAQLVVNAGLPPVWMATSTDDFLEATSLELGVELRKLGIAYKRDVDDVRESPSVQLMEMLRKWGAQIDYSDSNVPVFPVMREHSFDLASVPLTPETLAGYDAVLVLTDHSDVDYDMLRDHARLIVDARGRYSGVSDPKIVSA